MIIEEEGNVYGYFFIDSILVYELIDLGEHTNILVRFSTIYSDTIADCAVDYSSESFENELGSRGECEEDVKPIRILVMISEAATKAIVPYQKVRLFMEQLNKALDNSDITKNEAFFELAGIEVFENWEESGIISEDLADLKTFITQSTPDIRDEFGADLVVLLTNGDYDNCRTTGYAYQNFFGDPAWGFALVEGDGGIKYTFAHEVAHTLGCGHGYHPLPPAYARSRNWKHDGKIRSTIMSTGGSVKHRILHFSNPDVLFDGHDTGIENSRDNARQIKESAHLIADNFCWDPEMFVWIEGHTRGIEGIPYTWAAIHENCNEVVNYLWEISTDGINYTTQASGSTADQISLYLPEDKDLFIRLTVTCEDNQIKVDFIHVYNIDGIIDPYVTNSDGKIIASFTISPNPTSEEPQLQFELLEDSNVTIYRCDIWGRKTIIQKSQLKRGDNLITDTNHQNLFGLYNYILIAGSDLQTRGVLINSK